MKYKRLCLTLISIFLIFSSNNIWTQEVSSDTSKTDAVEAESEKTSKKQKKNSKNQKTSDENKDFSPFTRKIYSTPTDFHDFIHSTDFLMQLSPGFYMNPYSKDLHSGPAAPIYPISVGFNWPNYTFVSMQPTIGYFQMYYLWYDGNAYPAEIENRTAQSYNIMLDIPAIISIYPGKNKIQFSLGASFLFRFSSIARNVNPDDDGYSGNAQEDVKLINQWFWKKANFLYASTGICWERYLIGSLKGGPFVNVYFPIGSFINHNGFLGTVATLGVRMAL